MDSENQSIIDLLLVSEDYVAFDRKVHNRFHFNIARLVKDEIRSHKWTQTELGRHLTWEEAVNEWMGQYYEDFIDAIVPKGGAREFIKFHFSRYNG